MNLGEFLLLCFTFNAMALGNGTVAIPLFRRSLVEDRGVLTVDQLLYAFAIGQAAPGQANLYVASLGYMLFGLGSAVLSVLVINVPGYLMLPLARGYERYRGLPVVRRFVRGLTSASVGLIFAATVDIGRHALTHPVSWVAFLLTLALTHLLKWNTLASLTAASGAGVLLRACT